MKSNKFTVEREQKNSNQSILDSEANFPANVSSSSTSPNSFRESNGSFSSHNKLPRLKTPGFPKRVAFASESVKTEISSNTIDSCNENFTDYYDFSEKLTQQAFQQQQLLEFSQANKRLQVEKSLPSFDELENYDNANSSSIGHKFAALDFDYEHYENQLQQHYENRDLVMDSQSTYATNGDSKCGNFISNQSTKNLTDRLALSDDDASFNYDIKLCGMPVLEDGLSSNSDSENNNNLEDEHNINYCAQNTQVIKALQDIAKSPTELSKLDEFVGESFVPSSGVEENLVDGLSENVSKLIVNVEDDDGDANSETDRLIKQQSESFDKQRFDNMVSNAVTRATALDGTGNTSHETRFLRPIDDSIAISKEPLIEGVLFRARYLGSTQLSSCDGQPTKSTRMMQAEKAVSRIKAPEGENQPSTEVDLFISTEKIMVLNIDIKEIMMDHTLKSISYIADIGNLVVLMARRKLASKRLSENEDDDGNCNSNRKPKMICHIFESEEANLIAQSIGQAFQVAYKEFLKANGIEDNSFMSKMDYQEVLNCQEIFGDELEIFAKKELQKEVVVPKAKGEILGVVIVESGWGSMLPTFVLANLASNGAAARCGQLNIGDQIIAINGMSLVGLPLSQCQNYIKKTKTQTAVKITVVPCPPVVEIKIKRPNTKYQLGFSVQNGVICSLLRGGIAERGGVRVGHRIIEINNQSVVAVSHDKIVGLLATSVGEILMKTMPTSIFKLLTGQESPIYI